jgi:methylmalonyl-CoA carboxyltransferase large subunit
MSVSNDESREIATALAALRAELDRLQQRIDHLEGKLDGATAVAPLEVSPVDESLVVVISAAIAAFLGKRPHIRQIRLLGSAAWSQQGRIAVHGSHALDIQHG